MMNEKLDDIINANQMKKEDILKSIREMGMRLRKHLDDVERSDILVEYNGGFIKSVADDIYSKSIELTMLSYKVIELEYIKRED